MGIKLPLRHENEFNQQHICQTATKWTICRFRYCVVFEKER